MFIDESKRCWCHTNLSKTPEENIHVFRVEQNQNSSDSKIEQIAELNNTSVSKIEHFPETSPESKRDKGACQTPNAVKYSIGDRLIYSRNGETRKVIK